MCPKKFCDRKDLNRHVSSQHANSVPREDWLSPVTYSPRKRRRLHAPQTTEEVVQALLNSPDQSRERSKEAQIWLQYPSASVALDHLTTLMSNLDVNEDHQTSESEYQPYEMVSVHGALVVVTSRDLVLELRSDFNPRSEFKLRSITVPRQRMKIGRSLRQPQDYPPEEKVRVILVDRGKMVVLELSALQKLSRLLEALEASMKLSMKLCVVDLRSKITCRSGSCKHMEVYKFAAASKSVLRELTSKAGKTQHLRRLTLEDEFCPC